jgi:hypothetical protein
MNARFTLRRVFVGVAVALAASACAQAPTSADQVDVPDRERHVVAGRSVPAGRR